jgi:hypothetical protein
LVAAWRAVTRRVAVRKRAVWVGGAAKVSVGFGLDLQRNQMVAILRGIGGCGSGMRGVAWWGRMLG